HRRGAPAGICRLASWGIDPRPPPVPAPSGLTAFRESSRLEGSRPTGTLNLVGHTTCTPNNDPRRGGLPFVGADACSARSITASNRPSSSSLHRSNRRRASACRRPDVNLTPLYVILSIHALTRRYPGRRAAN